MYPAGKVAISQHLATSWFAHCNDTVGKLSANAGSLLGPAKDPSFSIIYLALLLSILFP
jgi:hypothetical protein